MNLSKAAGFIAGLILCSSFAQAQNNLVITPTAGPSYEVGYGTDRDISMYCLIVAADSRDRAECVAEMTYTRDRAEMENSNRLLMSVCDSIFNSSSRSSCRARLNKGYYAAEAINVCASLFNSDSKVECIDAIRNNDYMISALNTCESIFDSTGKVNCLKRTANNYYSSNALNTCNSLFNSDSKLTCLDTIANKLYQDYLVSSCDAEFNSNSKISCLAQVGEEMDLEKIYIEPSVAPQSQTDVLVDVLIDELINTINGGNQTQTQSSERCDLVNSNNNQIYTADGYAYADIILEEVVGNARQYAVDTNSCVILERKGTQKSSVVIDSDGSVLLKNVSQKEANDLKAGARCKRAIAICN